jgi:hypothetical protein
MTGDKVLSCHPPEERDFRAVRVLEFPDGFSLVEFVLP